MRFDIFEQRPAIIRLTLLVSFGAGLIAQTTDGAKSSAAEPARAIHILGLENVPKGANGHLSIQAGAFQFQQDKGSGARIALASIQSVSSGEQDRQVGGVPMTVGQVATPFGGGRVVGLFSHKKFDTLTVEYLDPNGGLHGAVFQLTKGQGDVLRNTLQADGAQITQTESHHDSK
jgi:hypothetical protein